MTMNICPPRFSVLTSIFATVIIAGVLLSPVSANAHEETESASLAGSSASLEAIASQKTTNVVVNSKGKRVAEDEARKYGLKVKWVSGNRACPNVANSIGCYSAKETNKIILVNSIQKNSAAGIKNVVRHESAHHAINVTCGTTSPGLVGKRTENVTDAYAATYYGMSTKNLAYGFNKNDVAIAKKIRKGECYKTQKNVTLQSKGWNLNIYQDSKGNAVSRKVGTTKGQRLTYLYRYGNSAVVRDGSKNIALIDINAILDTKNMKQVTITDTSYVPTRQNGGAQVFPKHGEKIRLTNVKLNNGFILAITNDGKGDAVYLNNASFASYKGNATVTKGALPYETTKGAWKSCANCVPVGAKVNKLGTYSKGFTKVVYKGRSFVIADGNLK